MVKRCNIERINLAPVMNDRNAKLVFTNMKDIRSLTCMTNASFDVQCEDCRFRIKLFAVKSSVEEVFLRVKTDRSSKLVKHSEECGHVNNFIDKRSIVQYKSERDIRYAKGIQKYE